MRGLTPEWSIGQAARPVSFLGAGGAPPLCMGHSAGGWRVGGGGEGWCIGHSGGGRAEEEEEEVEGWPGMGEGMEIGRKEEGGRVEGIEEVACPIVEREEEVVVLGKKG